VLLGRAAGYFLQGDGIPDCVGVCLYRVFVFVVAEFCLEKAQPVWPATSRPEFISLEGYLPRLISRALSKMGANKACSTFLIAG
jgi:hypothetical protein